MQGLTVLAPALRVNRSILTYIQKSYLPLACDVLHFSFWMTYYSLLLPLVARLITVIIIYQLQESTNVLYCSSTL